MERQVFEKHNSKSMEVLLIHWDPDAFNLS